MKRRKTKKHSISKGIDKHDPFSIKNQKTHLKIHSQFQKDRAKIGLLIYQKKLIKLAAKKNIPLISEPLWSHENAKRLMSISKKGKLLGAKLEKNHQLVTS